MTRPASWGADELLLPEGWRGGRLLLALRDPVAALRWLLAAQRAGVAVAVGDPAWTRAGLAAAASAVSAQVVVSDRGIDDGPGQPPDSEVGWISFSSGSTGLPRAVARTRASWSTSFEAFTALTGQRPGEVVLVPGPLHASMFCFAAVHALSQGGRVRALADWNAQAAVSATAHSDIVHLVPAMLQSLLDTGARPSRLRLIVSAGAKLGADLQGRAAEQLGVEVLKYYGSSEQSFVAARRGGDAASVGTAFPGVQLRIRDGQIWTRSPYACLGYLGAAGGALRNDGDWITVGDRGSFAGGVLTVHGRADAAIVTGGVTVLAEDVEAVLRQLPGVRDVVVVGLPDPRLGAVVVAVLELQPGAAIRRGQLRDFAAGLLAPAGLPRRWYVVTALPRTSTGKPAREAVRLGVTDGSLKALRAT